jgi:hypothetical protein
MLLCQKESRVDIGGFLYYFKQIMLEQLLALQLQTTEVDPGKLTQVPQNQIEYVKLEQRNHKLETSC